MKKRSLFILLVVFALLLSACSGKTKTAKTQEDAKELVEEYFDGFSDVENIKMETYSDGVLSSTFVKDHDKMYVNYEDAYGYYLFMMDGTKYLIADDGSLYEDESMYDMTVSTLEMLLQFNVLGYFYFEEEDNISYDAKVVDDKDLTLKISGSYDGEDFEVNISSSKEDGKITNLTSSVLAGEVEYGVEYKFSYDATVELPEYKAPIELPHVESPFNNFGEVIATFDQEDLLSFAYNDQYILIVEKDGSYYQLSATLDEETLSKYYELDTIDDDYNEKVNELIADIEIEDCVDFTSIVMTEEEKAAVINKTIGDLVIEGFEVNGWSFYDDEDGTEYRSIYLTRDGLTYLADVSLPENFDANSDFEAEDLYEAIILSIEFDGPEYSVLPF